MRGWIRRHRLLVLLLGAGVLSGYTHQLFGQVVSHHHADCADCAGHSDHGGHPDCSGDHDHPQSSTDDDEPSPADGDSSCHCDQCHSVVATVDFPAGFAGLIAVSSLESKALLSGPEGTRLPLDRPPNPC